MIIKLLFVIFIIFILKVFLIRFNYHDFFYVVLSLLFIFFSYLYIIGSYKMFVILIIIVAISLIIYSFLRIESRDDSLIISQGIINFKNMFKSSYSFNSLLDELKRNNISFLDENICAILRNNKLLFYVKKDNLYDSFIPIITEGVVNKKSLYIIKKSRGWLDDFLYKKDFSISDIKLLFYYKNVFYIIKK